jgi:thiamine transport system permease protein
MLRLVAPQALAAIFLICLTSFVIILTLGGGPGTTTLELGIYQSLRFDFLPGRAAGLALLQMGMGLGAALVALSIGTGSARTGLDRPDNGEAPGKLREVSTRAQPLSQTSRRMWQEEKDLLI